MPERDDSSPHGRTPSRPARRLAMESATNHGASHAPGWRSQKGRRFVVRPRPVRFGEGQTNRRSVPHTRPGAEPNAKAPQGGDEQLRRVDPEKTVCLACANGAQVSGHNLVK